MDGVIIVSSEMGRLAELFGLPRLILSPFAAKYRICFIPRLFVLSHKKAIRSHGVAAFLGTGERGPFPVRKQKNFS